MLSAWRDCSLSSDDRHLIPTFEVVFSNAPTNSAAVPDYLDGWKTILDVIVGDYDRGESYLLNTYGFLFANIVAAHESTGIEAAADHLGVPEDIAVTGEHDIFIMDATDQTTRGGEDHDAYVFGLGFGADVIDDAKPPLSNPKDVLIRFADIASTEMTATRQGFDLSSHDLALAA